MLRIATRASALARWQAERVGALLGEPVEYVLVTTTGDRDQRADLHAIGGTGVFVKEVQQAVLDGRAELAVHSAKDLPSDTPDGLVLAAIPERGDPRDALAGAVLDAIPTGGRIGTGSVRRRARARGAATGPGLRPTAREHRDPPAKASRRRARRGRRGRRRTRPSGPARSGK